MFNTRKQLSKHVDKEVKKILSILPHKTQRNLRGLAVARIYHEIQDYPKVIQYLNLFIQAKNLAVAHKLIAHAYRLLKIPDLQNAMQHYYRCININPHQTGVIEEVCQLLLNEESIFSMECAKYWLDLASSKNLDNNEAVGFLRVRVCFIDSYITKRGSSLVIPSLNDLGPAVDQFLKSQRNCREDILNESYNECIEKMKVIMAATDKLKRSGASDQLLFETPELPTEFQLTFEQEASKESKKSNKAGGPKSKQAAEQPRPSSLQGQKAKKPVLVEEVIKEKNKEMPLEQIAKRQLSKREQAMPAGLDQGNALNSSTNSSSGKSTFGLAPAANSVTGGFTFGALNTPASVDQMTKNSNIGEIGSSPFKYPAPAVVAPTASLRSSGRLSSLIPKPTQQHQEIDLKLKELLFMHHAKLYLLTDGNWEIRGQGDVKILRDIKSKELRVIMRQKQALNLCLNHMLNTDVVYKPMDKKSWIFAAHDFSDGKDALGRFALRFKSQNVAHEFNSVAKNALNGTAEAIKG